eukprot:2110403-Prymnesium_polylepis.3
MDLTGEWFELDWDDDDQPPIFLDMRYFNLVEPNVFVARGQGGHHNWPNLDTYDSWLVRPGAEPDRIVDDTSTSQSLWVRKVEGKYYGIGGESVSPDDFEFRGDDENRDGLRVLQADSLEDIKGGSWMHPSHDDDTLAIPGNHPGCVTARQDTGYCMFDNKVSVVRKVAANGMAHWLLYVRANLKQRGGRFVHVAKTTRDDLHGPWEPFQLIDMAGYDRDGPGNVYFLAADINPLDDETIIGLMPINEGDPNLEDSGNGDGDAYIAMSISCDGFSWSSPTKLIYTTGLQGRTYDHPVDGLLYENSSLFFMVHNNVPHISPHARDSSRILKYELRLEKVRAITAAAKASLPGCPAPSPPAQ